MTSRLLRSFVHGKFIEPSSLPKYELRNAANDMVVNHFHPSDTFQINAAIASSKGAQKKWAAYAPSERSRILRKAADLLTAKTKELAQLETLDTGRPISETNVADVTSAVDCLHYYAGIAPSMGGSTVDLPGGSWSYVRREAIGTTVGIGAWNYPLQVKV